ncbi:hypothetical protein QBC39DRAFT_345538 [Podospora conica]|nr:hypothetical protein QBC39DRAFT_345538 [Schizothecium conicum]
MSPNEMAAGGAKKRNRAPYGLPDHITDGVGSRTLGLPICRMPIRVLDHGRTRSSNGRPSAIDAEGSVSCQWSILHTLPEGDHAGLNSPFSRPPFAIILPMNHPTSTPAFAGSRKPTPGTLNLEQKYLPTVFVHFFPTCTQPHQARSVCITSTSQRFASLAAGQHPMATTLALEPQPPGWNHARIPRLVSAPAPSSVTAGTETARRCSTQRARAWPDHQPATSGISGDHDPGSIDPGPREALSETTRQQGTNATDQRYPSYNRDLPPHLLTPPTQCSSPQSKKEPRVSHPMGSVMLQAKRGQRCKN